MTADPIVFLPGLACDARVFLPQIVRLCAAHPVQVIVPRGESVDQMSSAVLAAAPPRFVLVGQGLGGDVALDVIRRDLGRVIRVALISTDPLAEPPGLAAARETRMVAARAGRLRDALAQDYPMSAFAETPWRDDVLSLVADMGIGLGEGVYLRQARALQRRPDQQKTLRRAMLPALILAGAQDTVIPVRRQDFAATLMPFGTLKVIENAGQLPSLEQPDAVTDALASFFAGPLLLR